MPSSRSGRRRRCWASPISCVVLDRSVSLRAAGWAWLAYVLGTGVALLAHNTAVFLPIGANILMVGWWWGHGRGPRGFLSRWLLAQFAVLCLWASWLPAYLHQVVHGESNAWIAPHRGQRAERRLRPLRRRDTGDAVHHRGARGPRPCIPRSAELETRSSLARVRPDLRPHGTARRADRQRVATDVPHADADWAACPSVSRSPRDCSPCDRVPWQPRSSFSWCSPAWDSGATTSYTTRRPGTRSRRTWTDACNVVTRSCSAWASWRSRSTSTTPLRGATPCLDRARRDVGRYIHHLQETRTRKRVWLIVSHPQPSTDAVIASLEGAGRLTEVAGFTDVDVYLYEIGEG